MKQNHTPCFFYILGNYRNQSLDERRAKAKELSRSYSNQENVAEEERGQ